MLGAHVNIPRTSETQWQAPSFRPVPWRQAIPGDLVFGNEGEQIAGLPGHVILAIGGGKAICAQHSGTNVTIMDITSAFSAGDIMGAKRPLPAVGEGPYQGGPVIGNGAGSSSDSSSGGGSSLSFVGSIRSGLGVLTDPHTYYRAGQVIAGAILVIVGLLMFKQVRSGVQTGAMVAAL